ncbi:MAG: zinc ribbon domain-containing protein [Candidatus Solibacter sp.]
MPEFCTCGAQLPPDALFCHKCGKPQREIIEPEHESEAEVVEIVIPPVPAAPPPSQINFHNWIAMRIAFVFAPVAILLSFIPAANFVLWVAAGFMAVFFYRRRTGVLLNVRAGVRLGWVTGVIMFAITTVMFTLMIVPVAADGGIAKLFRQQLKNASDPQVQEALRMLESGTGMASVLLVILLMLFVFITLLSMAGGALGAKFVGRDHSAR